VTQPDQQRGLTRAYWIWWAIGVITSFVLGLVIHTWWKYLLVMAILGELFIACVRWRRRPSRSRPDEPR
jgi:hypothetical protein